MGPTSITCVVLLAIIGRERKGEGREERKEYKEERRDWERGEGRGEWERMLLEWRTLGPSSLVVAA